jgi:hypothetical protein
MTPAEIPSFRTAFVGFAVSTTTMIAALVLIAGLNA